jgi:hypothetical protein
LACTEITAGHNRRASVQYEACKTEFAAASALGSSRNQRTNLDRGVLEAGP